MKKAALSETMVQPPNVCPFMIISRHFNALKFKIYLAVVAGGHEQVARVGEPPQRLHPFVVALVAVHQLLGQVAVVDRVPLGRERTQPQRRRAPRAALVVHFGALLAVEVRRGFARRRVLSVPCGQQMAAGRGGRVEIETNG